jgi:hypothetical protein
MSSFAIRFLAILGSAVLIAFPAALSAQSPTASPVRVGVGGGFTFPNGDIAAGSYGGINILAFATITPDNWPVGFEIDGAYHWFSGKDRDIEARVMSVTGGVMVPVAGVLGEPYLLAGAGYYNTQGTTTGPVDAERDFGAYGGLGIKFTQKQFEFRIEARVHEIFAGKGADGRSRSRELIPLTFGIVF